MGRRSGRPPLAITAKDHHWIAKVNWQKADVFKPKTYAGQLQKTDVLVHTLGILLESDYKRKLNSNQIGGEDFCKEIGSILSPNPMNRTVNNSYDHVNRASAVITATGFLKANEAAARAKHLKFVYISADKGFPGLPAGYINSKRAAEAELFQLGESSGILSTLVVRPGFMYDEDSQGDLRSNFNVGLQLLDTVNSKILGGVFNGLVRPTISTQRVSEKVMANLDNDTNSVLFLDQMLS